MPWGVAAAAVGAAGSIAGGMLGGQNSQSSSQYNKHLQRYTEPYYATSPWTFATLDPTATLAAMGEGSKLNSYGQKASYDFKQQLQGMSADEKAQAQGSRDALKCIQERQTSGQFLTPQETDFVNQQLDKAFESSRNIAFQDWTKGAQQLAGSRGLRMSDTPVAQPAMQAMRDMQLGFSSQRAALGLDTTLKFSQNQMAFDQSLMDSLNSLQFNRWNARQGFLFGGGMQGASGIEGAQSTYGTSGAGIMQGAGMGASLASGFGGILSSIGSQRSAPSSSGGFSSGGSSNYGGAMGLSSSSVGGMFG